MPSHAIYTLGVEEEYQIIDPTSHDLSSSASQLLSQAQQTLGEAVQYEMLLSQIEVVTPVCQTLSEVRAEITHLRKGVLQAAQREGKQIAASGTHPFSRWQDQQFSPNERYTSIQQHYRQLANEQSIFGCHVHVGLANREEAVQVMNSARVWLATLLALTGNSPFFGGVDTGYASYRTEIWARWPFSGPPQLFSSLAEHDRLVEDLIAPGSLDNAREVYWDMRLSTRFPTIETRLVDVCLTIDEAVMVAGLIRALIQTCHEAVLRGEPAPTLRQEILRAAHWRAARYGLDADLLDPQTGQVIAAPTLIDKFLSFLRPALETQGDWEEVSALVASVLRDGIGATRQRRAFNGSQQWSDVMNFIVAETAKGT